MTLINLIPPIYVNVLQYSGVDPSGVADSTTGIQNAINSLTSGGTIFFPPGIYLVSSALTFPVGNITLLGAGSDYDASAATVLRKSANIDLIDMSGSDSANHLHSCRIRDLTLDGNSKTGKLLRLYYADTMYVDRVRFYGNNDMAIESVEFFDSYFTNCWWSFCGTTTVPAVSLKNSATASGFGHSDNSTNMIWFVNCHWEPFYNGALWIEQGVSNTQQGNGFYLVNCKAENALINGPFFKFGSGIANVHVAHLTCSADSFNTGYSTPVDAIVWNAIGSMRGVYIYDQGSFFASGINYNPGGPSSFDTIRGVSLSTLINLTGGTSYQTSFTNISLFGSGTKFANNTGGTQIYPITNWDHSSEEAGAATPYTPDLLNTGDVVVKFVNIASLTINEPATKWAGATLRVILISDGNARTLSWDSHYKANQTALPTVMPTSGNYTLTFVCNVNGNWYRLG